MWVTKVVKFEDSWHLRWGIFYIIVHLLSTVFAQPVLVEVGESC